MAGENEDRDESMEDSPDDDDLMGSNSEQSECEGDLDLEEMDFFAANQACPVHPHLKEDIRKALSAFPEAEDELGIPAVQIDETRTNLKYISAIALTYTLKDISEHLLQIWDLEDTPAIIMELDNIHRGEFRTYIQAPTITVKKHSSEGGNFIVGEQLKNFALMVCRETFSLRTNDSPSVVGSFFENLYRRVKERLVRLSEYCVTCGEKLQCGGVMPSICERDLCMYQYSELHLFDGMSVPRVSPDVLSLLLFAFGNANMSYRRRDILTPAPPIKSLPDLIEEAKQKKLEKTGESGDDGSIMRASGEQHGANSAMTRYYSKLPSATSGSAAESTTFAVLLEFLPCPKAILSSVAAYGNFRKSWPLMADIVDWLVITNRSYLEKVPREMTVDFLHTESQYCFISDTPAKQAEFDRLVQENGGRTRFFFHGSPAENWHSIIRSGLKNMSGTRFQLVGAAYGNGIYLSPFLDFSIGYASRSMHGGGSSRRYGSMTQDRTCRAECTTAECCETEKAEDLACVALVEVVDCKDAYKMKTEEIYVVEQDKWCSIRMLLLYRSKDIDQLREAVDKIYSDPQGVVGTRRGGRTLASLRRGGPVPTPAQQQQQPVGSTAGNFLTSIYSTVQGYISQQATTAAAALLAPQPMQQVPMNPQLSQPAPAAPPSSPQLQEEDDKTLQQQQPKYSKRIAELEAAMKARREKKEKEKERKEAAAAAAASGGETSSSAATAAASSAAATAASSGSSASSLSSSSTPSTPSVITLDDYEMDDSDEEDDETYLRAAGLLPGPSGMQRQTEREREERVRQATGEEAGASTSAVTVREEEEDDDSDWMEVKNKKKKEKGEKKKKEKKEKRKSGEMEGAEESAQVRRAKAAKEKAEKEKAKRMRSSSWSMGESKKDEEEEEDKKVEVLDFIEEKEGKKEEEKKEERPLTEEDLMVIGMFDDDEFDEDVQVLTVKKGSEKSKKDKKKKVKKMEEDDDDEIEVLSFKEGKKKKEKKAAPFSDRTKELKDKIEKLEKALWESKERKSGSKKESRKKSSEDATKSNTNEGGEDDASAAGPSTSQSLFTMNATPSFSHQMNLQLMQQMAMMQHQSMLLQQQQQQLQQQQPPIPVPATQPQPGASIPAPSTASILSGWPLSRRSHRSSLANNGVTMPGDLTSLTDDQRNQIYRVVHMFRNSGFEDRLQRHMNRGDEKKEEEGEEEGDDGMNYRDDNGDTASP